MTYGKEENKSKACQAPTKLQYAFDIEVQYQISFTNECYKNHCSTMVYCYTD